jgi:hypothetical protein
MPGSRPWRETTDGANLYVTDYFSETIRKISVVTQVVGISGRVLVDFAGYNDLGVKNATISLMGTNYSTTSDANGNFTLASIPSGNYTLIVTAPNMNTLTQQISFSGQNLSVTLPKMVVSSAAYLKGDVNDDNRVGLDDVIYILQILSGAR